MSDGWGLRRVAVTAAALTAAALTAAACSAFLDLEGLSSDASSSAEDSGAPSPAAPGDDAGAHDGGADAPTGRFCDAWPGARLCTDFDGVPRSSLPIIEDNGTLELSPLSAVSAPNSALVELDTPPSAPGHAALDLRFGRAGAKVRVAFDLRVMAHSKDYTETLMIHSSAGGDKCEIFIVLDGASWELRASCGETARRPLGTIPFDRWVNVAVTVDTTEGTGAITIDQVTEVFPVSATFAAGDLRVIAGVYYAKTASGPIRLAIDNLVVAE